MAAPLNDCRFPRVLEKVLSPELAQGSERAVPPPQQIPAIKAKSSSQQVASISVREIIDAVRVAPLQQASAANPYVGVQVEWVGYLKSAEQELENPNRARVPGISVSMDASEIVVLERAKK